MTKLSLELFSGIVFVELLEDQATLATALIGTDWGDSRFTQRNSGLAVIAAAMGVSGGFRREALRSPDWRRRRHRTATTPFR